MGQKQDQTHQAKQPFPQGHLKIAFDMLREFVAIKPLPYVIASEKLLADYLVFNPPSEAMPAKEAVYEAVRRAFKSAYNSIRPLLLQQYVSCQEEDSLGDEILQHLAGKYFFLPYLVIALAATPRDQRPERSGKDKHLGPRKNHSKRDSRNSKKKRNK